jgi:hypothetical protein
MQASSEPHRFSESGGGDFFDLFRMEKSQLNNTKMLRFKRFGYEYLLDFLKLEDCLAWGALS